MKGAGLLVASALFGALLSIAVSSSAHQGEDFYLATWTSDSSYRIGDLESHDEHTFADEY